jgi:hypothetical protein
MIDVEPLIETSFRRIFPEPRVAPDWAEVMRRSGAGGRRPRRRVTLAVAFAALVAAAVAVSPLGAAIAQSVSDFSGWLRGSPGKPASEAAQQAFERGNAKSWAGFPKGTKLRELIKTSEDGIDYTLFGFRSGESLCLRVVAAGAARGSTLSCAPLRELRARPAPALVMEVDYSIGTLPGLHAQLGPDRYTLARASVSFGIAADNVKAIRLRSGSGARYAPVASNSFLSVLSRPPAGDRVQAVKAKLRDGRLVTIPFAPAPFDMYQGVASHGTLHGPTKVDRIIKTGTIGWVANHELRGTAWPHGRRSRMFPFSNGRLLFGRVILPDPQSRLRIGLSLWKVPKADKIRSLKKGVYLCTSLIVGSGAGGGCSPAFEIFKRSPVSFGLTTFGGGDQYSILSGSASDDVVRLRLYLGTGEVVSVPLRDNTFATQISRAKFPFRLVGYDSKGRVIANDAMRSESGPSGPAYRPAKNARWKRLARVTTASGGQAELWTVRSQAGGACWRLRFPGGGGAGGCAPPNRKGALRGDLIPAGGGPAPVLMAEASTFVNHVVILYRSGLTETVKPIGGFVLYAVPKERVDAADHVVRVTAFDASGAKIGQLKAPR